MACHPGSRDTRQPWESSWSFLPYDCLIRGCLSPRWLGSESGALECAGGREQDCARSVGRCACGPRAGVCDRAGAQGEGSWGLAGLGARMWPRAPALCSLHAGDGAPCSPEGQVAALGAGGVRSPGCLPRRAPCASARVRGVRDGLGRPQELLAERQGRQGPRSVCGRLRQAAVLGLVWLLCLGTTVGCTVAVYAFSELMIKVRAERGRTARGP